MGGYNSGRYGWHGVMESRKRLDIRDCRRRGWLHAGASGRYECNRDGEPWRSQQRKDVTELRKQVGELGK